MWLLILLTYIMIIAPWESAAITNKRTSTRYLEQSDSVRYFRHIPPRPTEEKLSDWEVGLREAIHQALLREGYWEPNLRERLTGAQLIGRQDHATPFGDVAVLARGQLYAIHAGNFMLLQDPYQNDCDDCYNPRRCERHDCQPYSPHNQEILVALWTVKRIRHRDVDRTRFDLEYIVSPLNANNDQIIMRRGKFNYAIPGHVFAVRSGKSEKNYPEVYNRKIPQNNFKPQVPLGVDSEGHRNVLYSYPGFFTSLPAQYLPPGVSDDTQEAQLYKKLLEALASKTSTTQQESSHVSTTTSMEETTKVTGSSQEQIPTTPSMPTSPMTISATASTVPETVPTMKTTITYYMPTGEEILMPETELPTTQKFSPTTKPSSRPTKKYTTKSKTTKIPNSTKKPTKTTFSTTKRPTTTPKTSQLPSSTKKPIKTTISTTKTPTTTSIIPSTTKMYVKPLSRTPTSPTTTKIIKTSTTPIPVTTSRPMTQKTSTKRPSGFTKFTKPSRKTTIPITTVTTTTRVTTTSPMPPTVISTQYQAPTKTTEHAEGTSTEYQTSPQPTASTEVISTQYQAPTKTTIPSTEMPTTIVTTTSPTTLMSTTSPQVEETSTEPATVTEETGTTKITTTNFETTSTTLPSTEYETKLPTAEITTEKTTVPEETVTTSLESTSTETTTQTPFSTMTTTASTTTKTTTKPTSRRTTTPSDFLTEAEPYNGPIYVGSVKNDYSLDDIFGPTTQTEKPTSTSTTRHTESDISQQLFGGELPENSKIIFSGFYEASTTANEDNDRKKKASQILTSQSYETEVSYEVNKRSNTESVGVLTTSTLRTPTKPMFRKSLKNRKFDYTRKKPSRALKTTSTTTAVETTTMESTSVQKVTTEGTALFADPPVEESVATTTQAVEETSNREKELEVFTKGAPANILIPPPETPTRAIVKQMPTNRTDFVIYKAEYPDEATQVSIPENTKDVFDDLALRLVSHAKGLEYLNRTNRTAKVAKYRRRKPYVSRSNKRPVRKKKEPEEEQKT
ncbi:uncharacterized protein LOC126879220 [Diabrotica virgifera virgifera]|uniref:Mucin-2-like n=1 Tax=Diabrotica virgifera virgifera TaxID=50390 RepID=A0ABM5JJW7_DIAVI|nr:uncharacterized protein LOC126879220 [Diabrotica virgifera virgifera]